ncbi:MAG: thiamine pyrophosphate-binding protein [Ilumatobacteraceae bacterium]
MSTRRKIAEALVGACRDAGTRHVFGVPGGGSNLDVVGAAVDAGLEFVLVHTETAAVVMAGVAADLTGAPGLCVATRGPGAASAVNGAAQALLDRQSVVVVTDCVAASDRDRVSHQRLDQQSLMAPVTLGSFVVTDTVAVAAVVALACGPRPGPVHVDIDPSAAMASVPAVGDPTDERALAAIVERIAAANRPVIVVGVGALRSAASVAERLSDLGARSAVPMLTTYRARGIVADGVSWYAGVATGATIESPLLHDADLIVGVGLDPVELIPAAWPYTAPVVSFTSWPIDDSSFFGDTLEVVGDLDDLLGRVAPEFRSTWTEGSGACYRQQADDELVAAVAPARRGLRPVEVVTIADEVAPSGTIATVDAGAHMLVAMPLWRVEQPGELLISSGLATMGFALPAAVAAAVVRPDRRVVCFTGDGGVGMVLGELETLARRNLPVTVVVFNDSTLSLIAAKQSPTGHGGAAVVEYAPTDFAAIARGCGVPAVSVTDVESYRRALAESFDRPGPTLLDVVVDPSSYGAVLDAVRGPR